MKIVIENLKCNGCITTIIKELSAIEGVSNVKVDLRESIVTYELVEKSNNNIVQSKLSSLGYPEKGNKNSLKHKVKSFVSCAIGRVNS